MKTYKRGGLPVPPKLILEKGTQSGMESAMVGHVRERVQQNKLNNHLNGGTKNKILIELPQTHGVINRGISGNDNSTSALELLSQAQANKAHDQVGPSTTKKGGKKSRRTKRRRTNRKTNRRKTNRRKTNRRKTKRRRTKRFRKRSRN